MNDDRPQLILDESLFVQAIRTLFELEQEEDSFELLTSIRPFVKADYVAARFKVDVGREMGTAEERAIEQYIAAVFLVAHHNHELSHINQIKREFKGPAMDFIRRAAWAFLSAWNLNYGAIRGHLRVPGTPSLVDPRQ